MKAQKTNSFQIYNASAGSGKTFTLVKEYLKILLTSSSIYKFQSILAMTFTNKASAEMKERVLQNLQEFSEGKTNDMLVIIASETNTEPKILQEKASKILHTILKNYSAFNITTIDSFTYSIVKTFAYDLKIPMDFEVEMDAQKLLYEAIDVLISRIGTDDALTNLLIDFSLQKSNDDKSWDITFELQNFSKILLNENDAQHIKTLSNKTIADFLALKNRLQTAVKKLEKQLKAIGERGLECIESKALETNDFYYGMLPKHFLYLEENYQKAKFFDQSKLRERIEENMFYSKSKPTHSKEKIEAILPELLDLYASSEEIYQHLVLYKIALESVVPMAVLNNIQKELDILKEDNNIRLNAEFNKLIYDTIKDEPAPFIYERLGEKYRHYFIDEMQDTSVLQWQNLQKLIENAIETEDLNQETGSLLLVGDAKQSIYRWRGSKPEQFIDLTETKNPFQVKKEVKNLETNYRSFSEIIDFNNTFFTHIANLLHKESYQKLYSETATQKINAKKGGYVEISFLEKEEEQEKELVFLEKILEIIQNLDSNFKKSDVCILVRKKAEGIAIANYLSENGINIISSETLLLENNAKINFTINVLQFLQDKNDQESRINALLFLYDFLQIKEEKHHFLSALVHLENKAFFKALEQYNIFFYENEFVQRSFYEAIEYLLRSFLLIEKADAYIQYFLDFVLEFQQQKEQTLSNFLEYWHLKKGKTSIVVPEMDNAVRIMTIHKAKGLEFPVVIFPYNTEIYRQINPKVWYDTSKDPIFEGFDTLLLNFKTALKYASPYAENLFESRREKLELDNFNLLYVALTRAEEQLYIVTQKKKFDADKINTFADVFVHFLQHVNSEENSWNEEQTTYCFGSPKRVFQKEQKTHTIETKMQTTFVSSNWKNHQISIVTNTATLWDTTQGKAIAFGNLTHKILSEIKTKKDIDKALKNYYFEGKIAKSELEYIKKLLTKVVTHPKLELYFSPNITIWNEREILSNSKEMYIPDRMVQHKDNSITILDYKTGAPEKKHKTQLEKYAEVMQEMHFTIAKKILIYINEAISIEEF